MAIPDWFFPPEPSNQTVKQTIIKHLRLRYHAGSNVLLPMCNCSYKQFIICMNELIGEGLVENNNNTYKLI